MSRPSDSSLRRIVLEAIVIAALGALVGLTFHYRLVLDTLGQREEKAAGSAFYPAPAELAEVEALLAAGGVAVDARARESFEAERISGAVSLPLGEATQSLPPFMHRFPRDTTLVVYCGGYGCPDSFDLALRLAAAGYAHVRVFEGGLPAWREAGLPVEEGE